jgi:hypothetical protein
MVIERGYMICLKEGYVVLLKGSRKGSPLMGVATEEARNIGVETGCVDGYACGQHEVRLYILTKNVVLSGKAEIVCADALVAQ